MVVSISLGKHRNPYGTGSHNLQNFTQHYTTPWLKCEQGQALIAEERQSPTVKRIQLSQKHFLGSWSWKPNPVPSTGAYCPCLRLQAIAPPDCREYQCGLEIVIGLPSNSNQRSRNLSPLQFAESRSTLPPTCDETVEMRVAKTHHQGCFRCVYNWFPLSKRECCKNIANQNMGSESLPTSNCSREKPEVSCDWELDLHAVFINYI